MIEKLEISGLVTETSPEKVDLLQREVEDKFNEIIEVLNAITDGADKFADAMDLHDWRDKVMVNLRTAANRGKG